MSRNRISAAAIMVLPMLALLAFAKREAVPADVLSITSSKGVTRFINKPIQSLFADLAVKTVVNVPCDHEEWLCVYVISSSISGDVSHNLKRFSAAVNMAGAIAVGANSIYISERYLNYVFQQAYTETIQYKIFLRHFDFSDSDNVLAAAKATDISADAIVAMMGGVQPKTEKLEDYERNLWGNYEARQDADRAALLRLLTAESAADGVYSTDGDVANAMSTLQDAGYPENVEILLSWPLFHEFRHLEQARNIWFRLGAIMGPTRRTYEDDADQFATEKVNLLLNRLVDETAQNSEKSAALQSALRASRSFWTMGPLVSAVRKVIGIPLSHSAFLVDGGCFDRDNSPVASVPSALSRFFTFSETARVYRSRSLLLSNDEFELLHEQIRAEDKVASHGFGYYRGIRPGESRTFDGRGDKLWNDENVEWSIQKALYNGSRGFLPDSSLSTIKTPLKMAQAIGYLEEAAPELREQDVANYCGNFCKLFVARGDKSNIRVELFPDETGDFVVSLNLTGMVISSLGESSRLEEIIRIIASRLMASGRGVVSNGGESTAEYIQKSTMLSEFERLRKAQNICGANAIYFSDGATVIRIQRSDDRYYQLQFMGVE